jgi:uncharacterized phage protein (TIGR01671 family)
MMNRVIKFRAWDGREFINDYYNQINYIAINGGALVTVQYDDVCPEGVVYAEPKRVTLMQFTGLHDKNGVEIYEGDIVHWGHIKGYEECLPRKAVVEFSPDLTFSTFNLERNNKFRFGSFAYRNTESAVEVIGNIYQNPELLK